eukprot:GEZU01012616.1.p1 GENE.GEZU01012616.1~~GEZU01012616.1.p1  ORF type:complete len:126 (-),score=29.96 GEZU01012616.1:92-469(-)
MATTSTPALMDEHEYHELVDETLETLNDAFESLLEEQDSLDDSDVELSHGVLTVKVGHHGTYVINKQTPNRQIWISSPVSGPARFDYDSKVKDWVYPHRNNQTLTNLLETELSKMLNTNFKINKQ